MDESACLLWGRPGVRVVEEGYNIFNRIPPLNERLELEYEEDGNAEDMEIQGVNHRDECCHNGDDDGNGGDGDNYSCDNTIIETHSYDDVYGENGHISAGFTFSYDKKGNAAVDTLGATINEIRRQYTAETKNQTLYQTPEDWKTISSLARLRESTGDIQLLALLLRLLNGAHFLEHIDKGYVRLEINSRERLHLERYLGPYAYKPHTPTKKRAGAMPAWDVNENLGFKPKLPYWVNFTPGYRSISGQNTGTARKNIGTAQKNIDTGQNFRSDRSFGTGQNFNYGLNLKADMPPPTRRHISTPRKIAAQNLSSAHSFGIGHDFSSSQNLNTYMSPAANRIIKRPRESAPRVGTAQDLSSNHSFGTGYNFSSGQNSNTDMPPPAKRQRLNQDR